MCIRDRCVTGLLPVAAAGAVVRARLRRHDRSPVSDARQAPNRHPIPRPAAAPEFFLLEARGPTGLRRLREVPRAGAGVAPGPSSRVYFWFAANPNMSCLLYT